MKKPTFQSPHYAQSVQGLRHARSKSLLPRANIFVNNIFGDVFGSDGKLKAQKPYERPLLTSLVKEVPSSYVLQEKLFSLSGEDFRVRDIMGEDILQIEGRNINLGGLVIDKLYFKDSSGQVFMSVERRIVAASTCYDIYSPDGKQLLAKVEREWLSATPKYKFYYEGDANPFADFEAEGNFLERTYFFKANWGDTIARVKRGEEVIKDLDTYEVEVAPGVDAAAIVACAVIIDEDHDEEDARKAREER
eukprot:gnl/MRDRNA2_/MRDRNA2_34811_c0_seq2.p1 gnl/MRDRNA2_/MRDRNA2_34811_c0~~gnl/MRDRNA2_/MRDRNA2_34811_c0_seq2.p1  ORF type:complete len:249 (+),score=64.59 gnl/MRDRNA2_/MRDRNA2_34811_c0_seq2:52-798(+)